ncbi:MFS transporter [Pelagibacterium limicola]|uniref:MFS transporter n=1 Tax=Pelagibacterium limicola TaxID=2791022 RepID=UPI0018AFAF08|nr:MFS transporter [Pelagibacterium limicola]
MTTTDQPLSGQDQRAAYIIMAVFFLQAFASGGIYARIPDIQAALGIGEATLGLALLGQPLGALTIFIFSGMLVEKLGTRFLLACSIPGLSIALGLMSLAPNAWLLGLAFYGFGASFAIANVSMNVEADRIEASTSARIMNRCHGLWSLGFLGTALLSTAVRGAGISQQVHLLALVPLVLLVSVPLFVAMRPAPPRGHSGAEKRPRFALPTFGTVCLVGFGLAGVLIEVMTRNWSVIFMRDSFETLEWVETLTLPAFLITMTAGRMLADGWTSRFGPIRTARILTLVSLVGLLMVVLPLGLVMAIAGFALLGLGVCTSFPLMLSAAARLGDRPAAENVAAVTMTMTFINLGTPVLIGLVAEALGIRVSFAMILPFLLLALVTARYLEPDKTKSST